MAWPLGSRPGTPVLPPVTSGHATYPTAPSRARACPAAWAHRLTLHGSGPGGAEGPGGVGEAVPSITSGALPCRSRPTPPAATPRELPRGRAGGGRAAPSRLTPARREGSVRSEERRV